MRNIAMKLSFLLLALSMGFVMPVHAEKADSDKPTQIDAQRGQYNDLKQNGWYEGNVVLVKGTLRIEGTRLDFRKDPEGYEAAVIVGNRDQRATFRQRRDSTRPDVEEYVAGQADRIEYDSKAETVKLTGHAVWQRLENDQLRDELNGNQIVYDSRTSTYEASADQKAATGDSGRVRTVIAPRRDSTASPSNPSSPSSTPSATPTPKPGPALTPASSLKAPKP